MKSTIASLLLQVLITVSLLNIVYSEETYQPLTDIPFEFFDALKSKPYRTGDLGFEMYRAVKVFSIAGLSIKLETDEIVSVNNETFITTKEFGKIKITFNPKKEPTIWLTSSQSTKLRAFIDRESNKLLKTQ